MTTPLHRDRLSAVRAALGETGARRVLDLGCGQGPLFVELARDPFFTRLVGVEKDALALARLRAALDPRLSGAAVDLLEAEIETLTEAYRDFDAALLVEVIEHLAPDPLKRLEETVFGELRPRAAIVTTPNIDFNPLLGVPSRRLRHPGHYFEWSRAQFQAWGARIADKFAYKANYSNVGGDHPVHGGPTQMAVFARNN